MTTTALDPLLTSAANSLRTLAATAVEQALRTDRNVGMSLSGGIDSSSVYVLSGRTIPCFTGYYEGEGYDEREYARLVAGPEHHEILITPDDFVTHFDAMIRAARPPFQGPGTFGQYMVARYASQHVRVMLSGEGGDELFGGYARLMIVAGEEPPEGYEDYRLPPDYPRDLRGALKYDFDRLGDLLAVDDQMLAAFDVEARAPFTDPLVVDFVLAQPAELRVGKRLLKQAMRGLVPDEILERRGKMGFPVPYVSWAQDEPLRSFLLERIGYVPDPDEPWARGWWLELCERSRLELGL
jgi:asparagine synthetase B (glutamine-hydrolysing)